MTREPPRGNRTPDPIDITVGSRLRTRRRAAGLSQAHLGQTLGISFQQIQKYERGHNRLSASMLVKAAASLGCSPSDLLGEGSRPRLPDSDLGALLTDDALQVITAFNRLSPARKTAALALLRALAATVRPHRRRPTANPGRSAHDAVR